MTIRRKFALWYAGILFVSLMAMGVLCYYEFVHEPRTQAHRGAKDDSEEENGLGDMLVILISCGAPSLALALGGGWWLMRKTLAPVAALTEAAESVTEHDLSKRLPCSGNGDELDRLTAVFNAMTERLNQSFQRMREFTLHASHELKTPLTIIHGELETALQDKALPMPYRQRLESELDEIQRLTRIVDGLSLLTKADAGLITLSRRPVRLDELVRETGIDAQSLARPHRIQVCLGVCEELTVSGDRDRLRQLLLNLADNATKYNQPGGTVSLELRRVNARAEFRITNTGRGISSEILPRVFDRFFRGDPSHSTEIDGCGLGLSIAQWIAHAHGGRVQITSAPGKLTSATLTLPLLE